MCVCVCAFVRVCKCGVCVNVACVCTCVSVVRLMLWGYGLNAGRLEQDGCVFASLGLTASLCENEALEAISVTSR